MNVSTITVFVEWTFILQITFLSCTGLIEAHNCTTVKRPDGGILEDCSYKKLVLGIPQDLDAEATEIDFSGNMMKNLAIYNGFDRYSKLRVLIMRNLTKLSHFSKALYLLKNVYSLEVVDFSLTYAEDGPLDFAWPPNVRVINLTGNAGLTDLAVDNLKSLEKLYASGIKYLENFPKFHELAQLNVLDLKYNTLIKDLSTDTISRLCYLDHLNITVNLSLIPYCECRKLRSWTYSYRIKLGSPIQCGTPSPAPKCDLKFTQDQLNIRRKCLARGISFRTSASWYKTLPFVLIIVLSLLIPSYLYASKYRKAHHMLHHPRLPKIVTGVPSATGTGDLSVNEEEEEDATSTTSGP